MDKNIWVDIYLLKNHAEKKINLKINSMITLHNNLYKKILLLYLLVTLVINQMKIHYGHSLDHVEL